MEIKRVPVGISDFKDVVTGNYYYIDKTLLISEILDKGSKTLLIPRPRRFGKTLNLSMLRYFFDRCPDKILPDSQEHYPSSKDELPPNTYKTLFENLKISSAGKEYTDQIGKYPVIFLSLKSIKDTDWNTCFSKIKYLIRNEYLRHDYLLHSPKLKPDEKDYFKEIIQLTGNQAAFENSLNSLLILLNRYYQERVVILIDEYDTPIHAAHANNYYNSIIGFMRNFLCEALKDSDQYLEKSVLTGILRIAKESIFSGLNNLGVYTLTEPEFSDKFGFTEDEVEFLLTEFNLMDRYEDIKMWYNGYQFGGETIYNPWSIINFLDSGNNALKPYWINTASHEIIDSLLSNGGTELKEELDQLIQGEYIEKSIDENIIMGEISVRENVLWGFLLMTGYLKYTHIIRDKMTARVFYTLSIPNLEVRTAFYGIIENYFEKKIKNKKIEIMLKSLIEGDILLFEEKLQEVVETIFSYHDFGNEPEKVYHALVAGLLAWISGSHEIKSNRESGYGRYDIMIIPRNPSLTGYVIEFKSVNKRTGETVSEAVADALKQIEDKKYETELIERGIRNIKKLAIVFSGKNVAVKETVPE